MLWKFAMTTSMPASFLSVPYRVGGGRRKYGFIIVLRLFVFTAGFTCGPSALPCSSLAGLFPCFCQPGGALMGVREVFRCAAAGYIVLRAVYADSLCHGPVGLVEEPVVLMCGFLLAGHEGESHRDSVPFLVFV